VLEITVPTNPLNNIYGQSSAPSIQPSEQALRFARGTRKQGSGVMLNLFRSIWPVAGLAVALVTTVAWIGLLGYVAIKLL